jgi:exodeoxyribonuclease VII large subunit
VLERGYALVTRAEDGSLVRSVQQVQGSDDLAIRVADGTFEVQAKEVKAG